MKFKEFILLDYNTHYYARKICSVTNELYSVKMTKDEFHHYYLPKGKNVKHLVNHNDDEKLFLETTLTPMEVKLLTPSELKLNKKLWKGRFKLKNKEFVNKEIVKEILK